METIAMQYYQQPMPYYPQMNQGFYPSYPNYGQQIGSPMSPSMGSVTTNESVGKLKVGQQSTSTSDASTGSIQKNSIHNKEVIEDF
jgi:hypothetical protein